MTSTEACRIKEAVRERDGYKCTRCGMTNEEHQERYKESCGWKAGRSLHVHRKVPVLGYSLSNCVTLCYPCHGMERRPPDGDFITLALTTSQHKTLEAARNRSTRRDQNVTVAEFIVKHSLKAAKRILKETAKSI